MKRNHAKAKQTPPAVSEWERLQEVRFTVRLLLFGLIVHELAELWALWQLWGRVAALDASSRLLTDCLMKVYEVLKALVR